MFTPRTSPADTGCRMWRSATTTSVYFPPHYSMTYETEKQHDRNHAVSQNNILFYWTAPHGGLFFMGGVCPLSQGQRFSASKPPLCKGRWHGVSRDGGIVAPALQIGAIFEVAPAWVGGFQKSPAFPMINTSLSNPSVSFADSSLYTREPCARSFIKNGIKKRSQGPEIVHYFP